MKCSLILILTLLITLGTVALADSRSLPTQNVTDALAQGATLEGPGYDTPEEAVQAYLSAFNNGDIKGMVSTFAIETWAEQLDTYATTEFLRCFIPYWAFMQIPESGDYLRSLRFAWRYGDLLYKLAMQYANYPALSDSDTIALLEDSELKEFYDMWMSSLSAGWAGHVEFLGWIDPGAVTGGLYYTQANLIANAKAACRYNCEDIVELIPHLRLNGEEALLFMTCGRYGGRWYNLDLGGSAANLCCLRSSYQALVTESSELWQNLADHLSSMEEYEGKTLLETNMSSHLTGTRWTLSAIDGDCSNLEIVSSREATEEHPDEFAWGQLNFTRCGYYIAVSRNLSQEYLFKGCWTTAAGIWTPLGDGAVLLNEPLEEIPSRFSEETITLTDSNSGLTYTFKPASGTLPVSAHGSGTAQAVRLEGPGYISAEEAVQAYIEAFNDGDVVSMLSTFAIETWAKHADGKAVLKKAHQINAAYVLKAIPLNGEYSLQARIAGRYGTLTKCLAIQYLDCGGPWWDYPYGEPVAIRSSEALSVFQKDWQNAPGSLWAGRIKFVDWIDLDQLTAGETKKPMFHSAVASVIEQNGCDEVTPMVAHITICGQDAALMFDCCRYGDRWYNLEPGGTPATFLSLESSRAGLAIMLRD